MDVNDILPKTLCFFEQTYPHIELNILRMSFHQLISDLYQKNLDAAISLDVNFKNQKDLYLYNWKPYHPAFAVPVTHPLA